MANKRFLQRLRMEDYCEYFNDSKYVELDVLYKYRDWSNTLHQEILLDNKVYMASPSSFEDEYDCNVPESFPSLEELPRIYYEKSFIYIPDVSNEEREEWVKEWSENSPITNISLRDEISRVVKVKNDATYGVLSLTVDYENEKMWEKYGADSAGVCFGFNKDKLFQVVGGGGPVIYTDNLPIIEQFKDDYITQHIKRTFYKKTEWAFEREYRLHKRWNLENPPTNEERNILMKEGTIVEIIFGSKMPQQYKDEIREIVQRKNIKVKIIEL